MEPKKYITYSIPLKLLVTDVMEIFILFGLINTDYSGRRLLQIYIILHCKKMVPLLLHPHRIAPTGWNIFSIPCRGL